MRICSGAGCLRKIADGVRYCDECKPATPSPATMGRTHTAVSSDSDTYRHLYAGVRWQKRIQPIALKRSPVCAMCERAISVLVDHIVPAGVAIQQARDSGQFPLDVWAGFYLLSNLRGLCRGCHATKTAEDKAHLGEWPDVVAKERRTPRKVWSF